MKKILALIITLLLNTFQFVNAQDKIGLYKNDLPVIYISKGISLHIISPEPINYADIPPKQMLGDFPVKNVLRVKLLDDTLNFEKETDLDGIITVVGESYIAQFKVKYVPEITHTRIDILPEHMKPLTVSDVNLTTPQMLSHAKDILKIRKFSNIRSVYEHGINAKLNQIYTIGSNVFLDISYSNNSNLIYDIDELRFKIEDKKITKATNSQSIEISPIWQLYPLGSFKKTFRNIYVIQKVTFPQNKVFKIELTEKQISGRTITLTVKYSDILSADTL